MADGIAVDDRRMLPELPAVVRWRELRATLSGAQRPAFRDHGPPTLRAAARVAPPLQAQADAVALVGPALCLQRRDPAPPLRAALNCRRREPCLTWLTLFQLSAANESRNAGSHT